MNAEAQALIDVILNDVAEAANEFQRVGYPGPFPVILPKADLVKLAADAELTVDQLLNRIEGHDHRIIIRNRAYLVA